MTKKKKGQPGKSAADHVGTPVTQPVFAPAPAHSGWRFSPLWIVAVLALLAIAYAFWACSSKQAGSAPSASSSMPVAEAEYVGAAVCADCHATEARDWQGSQHARAMQQASAARCWWTTARQGLKEIGSCLPHRYKIQGCLPDSGYCEYSRTSYIISYECSR